MKYNLSGTSNELRLEICALQKDYKSVIECNSEVKSVLNDDAMCGFEIALLFLTVGFIGFIIGRASA